MKRPLLAIGMLLALLLLACGGGGDAQSDVQHQGCLSVLSRIAPLVPCDRTCMPISRQASPYTMSLAFCRSQRLT